MLPESENVFTVREVKARITFVRDDKGSVTGLTLNQNGRDLPGKKIGDGETKNEE